MSSHPTIVTIADSASAALIDTSALPKTVLLPTATPGKFIYIADSNGGAGTNTIWISTNGIGLSIVGAVMGPGGMPTINRPYGAMAFLANGTNWYAMINEGGMDTFGNIYTSSILTSSIQSLVVSTTTIWAQTLNLSGGFSPTGGVTTANVSTNNISTNLITAGNISTNSLSTNNLTVSNVYANGTVSTFFITASNISTNSLSTNNAYIGTLTVGSETDSGGLSVAGTLSTNLITASNISTNSLSTNNLTVSNVYASGTVSTNLITASNISTNSISTNLLFGSNISTFNIGICNNAFITNSMNVGSNISSLSLNTGNISSASLFSVNVTNNSSFTASVQGNSVSTGKLYASAVYYNVQTL